MSISAIPSCFCNLQASSAYSEEFGLLYECHYLHVNPWTTVNVQGSDQVTLKIFDTIKIQLLQLLIIYDSQIY